MTALDRNVAPLDRYDHGTPTNLTILVEIELVHANDAFEFWMIGSFDSAVPVESFINCDPNPSPFVFARISKRRIATACPRGGDNCTFI
ncbi:hypothetical protein Poly24_36910 [Rosistilla carotiformis]|uniref:Uncharacterized protein n=1 Tax=Rosistilla carotiformis TaxID=2528017 RepID=A0A518JWQ3_9BACT|nr:hypothetical protein [Rosistilla carotiformis]QDV69972.1 hypothetical protein Poly24_36910 [Rosistilla carotiformis]